MPGRGARAGWPRQELQKYFNKNKYLYEIHRLNAGVGQHLHSAAPTPTPAARPAGFQGLSAL
jgi:hypothetical protein